MTRDVVDFRGGSWARRAGAGSAAGAWTPAGAADVAALRLAAALVGGQDAAVVEFGRGGLHAALRADGCVAITGSPFACSMDGIPARMWAPLPTRAGARLDIAPVARSRVGYLAVGATADRALDTAILCAPRRPRWAVSAVCWTAPADPVDVSLIVSGAQEPAGAALRRWLRKQAFRGADDDDPRGRLLQGSPDAGLPTREAMPRALARGDAVLLPDGDLRVAYAVHEWRGAGAYIGRVPQLALTRVVQLADGAALRFVPCSMSEADRIETRRAEALRLLESRIRRRRST